MYQPPKELTEKQLNNISTIRLLKHYRAIRQICFGETEYDEDCFGDTCYNRYYNEWIAYLEKLKNLLDSREHVEK